MFCHLLGRSAFCFSAKVCRRLWRALLRSWPCSNLNGNFRLVWSMCNVMSDCLVATATIQKRVGATMPVLRNTLTISFMYMIWWPATRYYLLMGVYIYDWVTQMPICSRWHPLSRLSTSYTKKLTRGQAMQVFIQRKPRKIYAAYQRAKGHRTWQP